MRPDQFLHQYAPERILGKLDEIVIGQDEAKRALVAAVWWNLYRATLVESGQDSRKLPAKLNVLLLGPSGSGKTELAKAVAGIFTVPWVTTSAPNYSSAGYTGADVDDMLGLLLQACGGDQPSAERGIIVLDEVDKLKRREFGGQSDVGCEAIQHAMLSLLDGCDALPRSRGGDRVKMRSHFVTFVGTGAFVGLNAGPGPVPAGAIISDGFIPEFVARWSMRIRLHDVDRDLLRKIVLGKQSALHRLTHLFALHGIDFSTDDKTIDALIDQALADGVRARGLNEAIWTQLNGLISEIPQMIVGGVRRVVVDPATLKGLPAWKIPGDTETVSEATAALLHPVTAGETVDTSGWSDSELQNRVQYLLNVKLNFNRLDASVRNQFQNYLLDISEKHPDQRVRVCEMMAFDFSPPCSIPEFLTVGGESETQNPEAILHLVRYRRAISTEQRAAKSPRAPRKRATCPHCNASIPSKSGKCPSCGAEA